MKQQPMAARTRHILILGLAIFLKTFAEQAPAIEPQGQPFKLTATAELVLLDVSVKDTTGVQVPGLGKNNFQIYESGQLQTITHFSSDDVPVTVGLVIDTSGSMRTKHPEVVTAALVFIHASNRQDEVFVVNFNDRASFGLPGNIPFTDDVAKLQAALSMSDPNGRTALYDALVLSLNHVEKGQRDKKTIVLVSDGGDNGSIHRFEDVMQLVRESRATIYTIGIFDEDDKDQNPGLLGRLARISGGGAFLPKDVSEVVGICRQIASDIRNRYTIGYVPVRSGEKGSLRKIKVVAQQSGGRKLTVRTRTSYFLPDNRSPSGQTGEANRKPGV
jgi:Ca-activated chloride channel family protein